MLDLLPRSAAAKVRQRDDDDLSARLRANVGDDALDGRRVAGGMTCAKSLTYPCAAGICSPGKQSDECGDQDASTRGQR